MDLTGQVSEVTRAQILREEATAAGGLTAQWLNQRADALDPRPAPRFNLLEEIARGAAEYDALPEWDRPILPRRHADTQPQVSETSVLRDILDSVEQYKDVPEWDRPIVSA